LFLKIGINENGETHYYLEKLILPLDSQTECFLFDVQLLWTTAIGRFLRKTAFYNKNFKFREAVKWGLKIFDQTTNRHTFTPNLVEQIVWRMWQ